MAPALFRRTRNSSTPSHPTPLSTATTATPPPPPPPLDNPPRSYPDLADVADEIVDNSWDPSWHITQYLRAIRQLHLESKVYEEEGNYDMAFVRIATVLKLQRDVLPHHHPEWSTLSDSKKEQLKRQTRQYEQTYSVLKSFLQARSSAYYASLPSSASASSASSSPALTLRNTVTPASTAYTDTSSRSSTHSTSHSTSHSGASTPLEAAQPRRAPLVAAVPPPPKQNRLRKVLGLRDKEKEKGHGREGSGSSSTGGGGGSTAKLPDPGAEEEEGEWELLSRENGRRIPKMGEGLVSAATSSPVASGSRTPSYPSHLRLPPPSNGPSYPSHLMPRGATAPMPIPGDDSSEEETEEEGRGIAYSPVGGGLGMGRTPTWSNLGGTGASTLPPLFQQPQQGGRQPIAASSAYTSASPFPQLSATAPPPSSTYPNLSPQYQPPPPSNSAYSSTFSPSQPPYRPQQQQPQYPLQPPYPSAASAPSASASSSPAYPSVPAQYPHPQIQSYLPHSHPHPQSHLPPSTATVGLPPSPRPPPAPSTTLASPPRPPASSSSSIPHPSLPPSPYLPPSPHLLPPSEPRPRPQPRPPPPPPAPVFPSPPSAPSHPIPSTADGLARSPSSSLASIPPSLLRSHSGASSSGGGGAGGRGRKLSKGKWSRAGGEGFQGAGGGAGGGGAAGGGTGAWAIEGMRGGLLESVAESGNGSGSGVGKGGGSWGFVDEKTGLGGEPAREEEEIEFARTESGAPLRPVLLPSRLPTYFMNVVAASNTERGRETCGLLLGKLSHNTLSITTLLIPKQIGSADTCETTHEEEQFAFQDERGLLTLGWIHTHPSQSCFLSSRDLHTHAGYQVMLPEAIAVVCAPRYSPTIGVFRMTDPPGLGTIVNCRAGGTFHEHPDLPLYTDVDSEWGHTKVVEGVGFECVDLR